jgi:uncharacterized protein YbaP (TraB family)
MKAILASIIVVLALTAGAKADPAMWEVRDGDSTIRLFGSVHMLPPDLKWRTPALEDAITKSEHVYFETDVGPRGFLALTVKMTIASFQQMSTPWLYLLDDDQVAQLADAIGPLGISLEAASVTPPWMLSMEIAGAQMSGDGAATQYSFNSGVEWTLQWDLVPDRKAYLETPGEQFDLIAAGTLEEQVAALVAMLGETGGSDALGEIIQAWAAGDVETLASSLVPKNDGEQAGVEMLLLNRNRNWIPTLEKLLAENREDLIVVGAAHLAGEGSVLDLLEKAGYTVTRIQ